jgi:hypothetical protein
VSSNLALSLSDVIERERGFESATPRF